MIKNILIAFLLVLAGNTASAQTITFGPNFSVGGNMSAGGVAVITTNTLAGNFGSDHGSGCTIIELDDTLTVLPDFTSLTDFDSQSCEDISDTGLVVSFVVIDPISGFNVRGGLSNTSTAVLAPTWLSSPTWFLTKISSDGTFRTGEAEGDPFSLVGNAIRNTGTIPGTTEAYSFSSSGGLIGATGAVSDGGTFVGGVVIISGTVANEGPFRYDIGLDTTTFLTVPTPEVGSPLCGDSFIADDGALWSACKQTNPLLPSSTNGLMPHKWAAGSLTANILKVPPCASVAATFSMKDASGNGLYARGIGCVGNPDIVWIGGGSVAVEFTDFLSAVGFTFPAGVSLISLDGFEDNFERFTVTVDDNGITKGAVIAVPEASSASMLLAGILGLVGISRTRNNGYRIS